MDKVALGSLSLAGIGLLSLFFDQLTAAGLFFTLSAAVTVKFLPDAVMDAFEKANPFWTD